MTTYLRTLRQRRLLSQLELAQRSGIAQNTISKLETNAKATPVFPTVVALARALDISPTDLRFGPDPRVRRRLLADRLRRRRARQKALRVA
jgi:transcriptional regulator with XRE-family HTH domain